MASEPEAPRRRSTVRESAQTHAEGGHHTAAETPQPVVISPAANEDADKPRRAGWWSRRVLGKE